MESATRRAALFIGLFAVVLGLGAAALGYFLQQQLLFLASGGLVVVGVLSLVRQARRNRENRPATQSEIDALIAYVRAVWERIPNKSERFMLRDETWQINQHRVFIYIASRLYLEITLEEGDAYEIRLFKKSSQLARDQTIRLWHLLRAKKITERVLNKLL